MSQEKVVTMIVGLATFLTFLISCSNGQKSEKLRGFGFIARDEWDLSINGGWQEYKIIKGGNSTLILPHIYHNGEFRGTFIIDVNAKIVGNYRIYHGNHSKKSLLAANIPFEKGELSGIADYWDKYGKLIRQEKWLNNKLIEFRNEAPFFNNVSDQKLIDGVYTEPGLGTSGTLHSPPFVYIGKQWVCKEGKIIETRTDPPWLDPPAEFWDARKGEFFNLLDPSGFWHFEGKILRHGDTLFSEDGLKLTAFYIGEKNSSFKRLTFRTQDGKPFTLSTRRWHMLRWKR